jgi:hypothetical protein
MSTESNSESFKGYDYYNPCATNSFIAGMIAGCTSVFIEQPLKTVKVRQQLSIMDMTKSQRAIRILFSMSSLERPFSLYKGMRFSIMGSAPLVATFFGVRDLTMNQISDVNMSFHTKNFISG